jgi:hypothetical protein
LISSLRDGNTEALFPKISVWRKRRYLRKLPAAAFGTYTGLLDGIPAFSAATSIKTSAEIEPVITIGTAALTAGKIVVFMEYVLSE